MVYCPTRRRPIAYPQQSWLQAGPDSSRRAAGRGQNGLCRQSGRPNQSVLAAQYFPSSLSQGDVFTGWMLGWTADISAHQLRIAEITDGTSQTYLLGEKTIDPDYYFDGLEYGDDWSWNTGSRTTSLARWPWESRLRPRLPLRTIHLYRTPAASSTTPASAGASLQSEHDLLRPLSAQSAIRSTPRPIAGWATGKMA